jgi:hypothetical protein
VSSRVFLLHEIAKIMITHLLLVKIGPFKRGGLVYGLFAKVGMRWEVRVTTTRRERAADGFGGERAIFSMSLASVAVGKAAVDDTTIRACRTSLWMLG